MAPRGLVRFRRSFCGGLALSNVREWNIVQSGLFPSCPESLHGGPQALRPGRPAPTERRRELRRCPVDPDKCRAMRLPWPRPRLTFPSFRSRRTRFVSLSPRRKSSTAKDVVTEPDPGFNPSDDAMIGVLEDHKDDPVVAELVGFIHAMSEDEQIDLVTLAWVGRGDGTLADWGRSARRGCANP